MKAFPIAALIIVAGLAGAPRAACAWGPTGHEWISGIAIDKLPDSLPAFVRTPEAAAEIAAMGREPDRSKGAGETHDADRDPAHYIFLADDGAVMGVVPLENLPAARKDYDTLLRAKGFTQYEAGYVPYAIVDGWQQIRKDFAYWRADVKGAATARTQAERDWFEADRRLRERLTLRDIGIWSHFVADASQPLHVSVHFKNWGPYPNPHGYTTADIDMTFEEDFVRGNLTRAAVAAEIGPYVDCKCGIWDMTKNLLRSSLAKVGPLYGLEKDGAFTPANPNGIRFAAGRLAMGAETARNMIVAAWEDSAHTPVGPPPMINMRDIEDGKVRVIPNMFGADLPGP
ncbi:MAG: hypothetical protein PSV46_05325 [Reyranella sp.]|nr:hypothetical protein [Reyranella sp.]